MHSDCCRHHCTCNPLTHSPLFYCPPQNGVSVLANDGAGGPAGSRTQGNTTNANDECFLLGYLPIAVDAPVSLLQR
jgi:hypothetical protein